MMEHGGFDVRNLLQGSSLALIVIYVGALVALGLLHVAFKGSIVV